MTAREPDTDQTYRCPNCDGSLKFVRKCWRCVDCGHIPNHAAD